MRAEAGLSPRRASNFLLLRQKKVTKEKAPPSLRPPRGAWGQPASGRLRGAPWNSLRAGALRSDNHGESDDEACALRRACAPRNHPAAGAASRGLGGGRPTANIHTGLCFARPKLACAARRDHGAERRAAEQWHVWMSSPLGFPSVRAEKRRAGCACVCRRTHALRALTCRSCLNGARSAQ